MSATDHKTTRIALSGVGFSQVKRAVREAYNEMQETFYEVGGAIYCAMRGTHRFEYAYERHAEKYEGDVLPAREQNEAILKDAIHRKEEGVRKIYRPRRKDFPRKKAGDEDFTPPEVEWELRFREEANEIILEKGGKRMGDREERNHPVLKALFKSLERMEGANESQDRDLEDRREIRGERRDFGVLERAQTRGSVEE